VPVPELDEPLRRRLRRFGPAIEPWLDALPPVLQELSRRWRLELGSLVPRGSFSAVIRCETLDGAPTVLKVSPDRRRIAEEATALAAWRTDHVPAVLAVDESLGALLLEAVEPGTPLAEADGYPGSERVADLITSLHAGAATGPRYPAVAARVKDLFDSSARLYEWKPELVELVPPALYERGRRLALRLADDSPATVLLHGDLTPANVLDGGEARGLVAIDPAACLGDPAFDAVDLVFWRAADVATIESRCEQLAPAIGAAAARVLAWCAAFAAMLALELAERGQTPRDRLEALVALAGRA
jgi:streptomycin 6-kinase